MNATSIFSKLGLLNISPDEIGIEKGSNGAWGLHVYKVRFTYDGKTYENTFKYSDNFPIKDVENLAWTDIAAWLQFWDETLGKLKKPRTVPASEFPPPQASKGLPLVKVFEAERERELREKSYAEQANLAAKYSANQEQQRLRDAVLAQAARKIPQFIVSDEYIEAFRLKPIQTSTPPPAPPAPKKPLFEVPEPAERDLHFD